MKLEALRQSAEYQLAERVLKEAWPIDDSGYEEIVVLARAYMAMVDHCCEAEQLPAFPAGWQIVPIKPPREMLVALAGFPLILAASDEEELRRRYEAMLAEAPSCRSPGESWK
jgi:hypothetical protein